jgi:hypothetical protein
LLLCCDSRVLVFFLVNCGDQIFLFVILLNCDRVCLVYEKTDR